MVSMDVLHELLLILKDVKPGIDIENLDCEKPLTSYGFDSLDMMNLYFLIEEKFGIKINLEGESSTTQLLSVEQLTNYILGQS